MEHNEIIKALECCSRSGCSDNQTKDCPLKPYEDCSTRLATDALSLIKELTKENERLEASIKILVANNANLETELAVTYDLLEDAKADTVRKMQERLKEHLEKPEFPWDSFTVAEEVIDSIAKEMLEGEK